MTSGRSCLWARSDVSTTELTSAMRCRKAWEVEWTEWYYGSEPIPVYFASTASKARYQGFLDIQEVYDTVRIVDIRTRRCQERDVFLPARDPMVDQLTTEALHILKHTIGADCSGTGIYKAGYRDYFFTRADDRRLLGLVMLGLMSGPHYASGRNAADETPHAYFHCTPLGRHVAMSTVPLYAGEPS